MQVDFLIIGQGIAGTLLSYLLIREGRSVCVIDRQQADAASRVAGAVINPVAIKGWKPVEGQEKFIPAALTLYREMEKFLDADLLTTLPVYVFDDQAPDLKSIPSMEALTAAVGTPEMKRLRTFFSFEKPPRKIRETWLVNAERLLQLWRQYLHSQGCIIEQWQNLHEIEAGKSGYRCAGVQARYIVFCEGASGRINPYFNDIPFTRNRGDALILDIPGLEESAIYHSQLRLVPKGDHLFWYGSNYQWEYADLEPNLFWRQQAITHLNHWLKLPFTVKEHRVAERPTTPGQHPIIRFHHQHRNMVMFNGLGTKGFSLGPALAGELCRQLMHIGA